MPKMTFYRGKFGRTAKMTPRSARRVIAKYVRKNRGSFTKRVQKIVDRSLKNTPTQLIRKYDSICKMTDLAGAARAWFTFTPGHDVFVRTAGSPNVGYPFEGQSCKIKKWWIKGTIQYDNTGLVSLTLGQSEVGFVDVMLVRTRYMTSAPSPQLVDFYQSGHDTFEVKGLRAEMMWPINGNTYKVYARKRFKMGAAWVRQDSVPAVSVNEQNNDFSYAKNFSFDVTKYVGKNHIVRYLGNEAQPSDNLLNTMTLIAIFHPACGDLGTPTVGVTGLTYRSAYSIDAVSWGEYETA